ncbi:MAG: sigma-70 family RNA polymerase sigma factor [Prevotella sp.]|nr:sigma-70 family RNA polymerase sigma factor [Prevotella sp.]
MIDSVKVSGFEEEEKLSFHEMRDGLLRARKYYFTKLVEGERENVLVFLMNRYKRLSFEDLEEVYNDGCLVLWERVVNGNANLEETSIVGLLIRICRNIRSRYLRKVNEDVESLDMILEKGFAVISHDKNELSEIFDVVDEGGNDEEMLERLESVWNRLKDVERMILECFYADGCKMEEISRRIGFKNANSVKTKKNKILRKIFQMMKEEEAESSDLPLAA